MWTHSTANAYQASSECSGYWSIFRKVVKVNSTLPDSRGAEITGMTATLYCVTVGVMSGSIYREVTCLDLHSRFLRPGDLQRKGILSSPRAGVWGAKLQAPGHRVRPTSAWPCCSSWTTVRGRSPLGLTLGLSFCF